MKQYAYSTYPGQTIIKQVTDGYTFEELVDELRQNGEGIILSNDVVEENLYIVGKDCKTI